MNIGEQINNLRKQHDLSQDDFANLFNPELFTEQYLN